MSIVLSLQIVLLAMSALLLALSFATAVRRFSRDLLLAGRQRRETRLRPLVMEVVSEDEPDTRSLDGSSVADNKALRSLAWQFLPKVRGAARQALVDWLIEQGEVESAVRMTRSWGSVRRARAAEMLGSVAVTGTSTHLVRLLKDRNSEVRVVAARSLGKFEDSDVVEELLGTLDAERSVPQSVVSMALLRVGTTAIEPLTAGLSSRSENVRVVSCDLLGVHGAVTATPGLLACLQYDTADVRVHAAEALGRIGMPRAVEPLIRSLAPGNETALRRAAAEALSRIGGRDAVSALSRAVAGSDGVVVSAAAEALSNMGDDGIIALKEAVELPGYQGLAASEWLGRRRLVLESRRSSGRSTRVRVGA